MDRDIDVTSKYIGWAVNAVALVLTLIAIPLMINHAAAVWSMAEVSNDYAEKLRTRLELIATPAFPRWAFWDLWIPILSLLVLLLLVGHLTRLWWVSHRARAELRTLKSTAGADRMRLTLAEKELGAYKLEAQKLTEYVGRLALPYDKMFFSRLNKLLTNYEVVRFDRFLVILLHMLQRGLASADCTEAFLVVLNKNGHPDLNVGVSTNNDEEYVEDFVTHILDTQACVTALSQFEPMIFTKPSTATLRTNGGWTLHNCGVLILAPIRMGDYAGVLGLQSSSTNPIDPDIAVPFVQFLAQAATLAIRIHHLHEGGKTHEEAASSGEKRP